MNVPRSLASVTLTQIALIALDLFCVPAIRDILEMELFAKTLMSAQWLWATAMLNQPMSILVGPFYAPVIVDLLGI